MKKFQFVSWLTATGIGIVTLVLASYMFFTRGGSVSLIHTTSDGKGCHVLSDGRNTVSLFVFRRDPKGPYGLRQLYQVDIRNPDKIDLMNIDPIINETGDVHEASRCLKWGSEDPETIDIPQSIREILASLSQ